MRMLVLVTLLFTASVSLFSQSRLIATDAPNNIYPITFTDPTQTRIVVHFDDFITAAGTTAGWTVTVGGAPVALAGNPTRSGQDLTLTLVSEITYANRNTVFVTYNDAAGTVALLTGLEPVFTNIQAINNRIATADDFTNDLYGERPPKDICAAVTNVEVEFNLILSKAYRNSIHYTSPRAWINWQYPAVTPVSYVVFTENTVGSGNYTVVGTNATYPDNTINCTWVISIFPYLYNSGTLQPNLYVTQNRVLITIPNYKRDNGTPIPGTGTLGIDPPLDDLSTLYCVGEDIDDFIFTEEVEFDCRYEVETVLPNINKRWMKFVYGSHSSTNPALNGIPNVYIQVGDSAVRVTDNNGNGIIRRWYVNPDGSYNAAGYFTSTGYFEGPLVEYEFNTTEPYGLITPRIQTYPISHTGDFVNDQVDDVFEVLLQVWGPCNSYTLGETPVEIFSRLRLVASPPPPTVTSATDCAGSVTPTLTATGTGGIINWYDDPNTTSLVYTGTTFTHGETAPNTYIWWVTETRDSGSGRSCPSDTSRSTLVINAIPNTPTISASGATTFCYDGATSVTLTADPQGSTITSYQWFRNGTAIAGATSNTITLSTVANSGSYTVVTYGVAPTYCESLPSAATVVTISDYATTTNPADRATCGDDYSTNGNTSFTVTTGGAAHSIRWQRRTSAVNPWVDITGGTTPNDNCTYSNYTSATLGIASVDYGMNGYQYRVRLTTTAGGCETYSDPATLTVYPVPTITTAPANTTVCEFDDAYFNAAASVATGSITGWAWQRNNNTIGAATDGGIYSGYNTANLTVNNPDRSLSGYNYRVIATSDHGCNVRSANATLTVNPLADITSQPANREICENQSTTFGVTTDGSPAVTAYQWQVSTDGGTSWANASGGIYSGGTSATLTLTNVPSGNSGYRYKCILTTAGPCTIETTVALLTVNPNPTAGITPVAPGELCNGDIINFNGNPNLGTAPYTHAWTGNTGPLSATNIVNPQFTAPVLGSQTTYNLTYTVTDSKGCTATDNESVVVNPAVTVNVTASSFEVCVGATVNLDGNPAGGTGAITSAWTGTGTGALSATNTATPVFTAPAVLVQTSYSLTYTATDTKSCEGTQTINIVVNPLPTANISPASPGEMCFNDTQVLDGNAAAGTAPYSHAWTGDVAPLNNSNSETPTFTAPSTAVQTTYNMTYQVQDSKGCTATDNVSVVVNPELQSAVLTGNASVCSGDFTDINVAITGGTSPYHVELTSAGFGAMTVDPYLTGADINVGPHTIPTNTFSIVTVTDAKGCVVTSPSGTATIIVGSVPTFAELVGEDTICDGQTQPLAVNITGGAPPYAVEIDAIGTINNYTSGSSIATGILPVGTHNYNLIQVTDNCGSSISGGAVNSNNPQQIVVNPIPVLSTTNNAPEICNGEDVDIDLNSTVAGTEYSWTVNDGGGVTWTGGNNPIAGTATFVTGAEKISRTLQHSMTAPVTVTYTITSAGPDPTSCAGNTRIETVQVDPTVVVTATGKTICSGDDINIDVNTVYTGIHGVLYTWTVAPNANVTGEADGPAAGQSFGTNMSQNLVNTSNSAQTVVYTITGYTTDALGNLKCDGTPLVVNVIVEPVVTVTGSDRTICNNTSTNIDINTPSSGSIGVRYSWAVAAHSDITGEAAGPNPGIDFGTNLSQTLQNTGSVARTATYTVTGYTIDGSGNHTCAGTPLDVDVIVEPNVIVTASDQTICSNNSTNIDVNTTYSGSVGVEYSWTVSAHADITGEADGPAAGASFASNISQSLQNTGTQARTATYTITGYTTDAGGNLICAGTPLDVDVIVEPVVTVTAADKTICSGTSTDLDVNTVYTGSIGQEYTWTVTPNANVTGESDGPALGQAFATNLSQTLTNTSTTPQVVTYHITGYTTDALGNLVCSGPTLDVDITVEPVVAVTAADKTICDNSSTDIDVNTVYTGSLGVEYTWTVSAHADITGETDGPAAGQAFATNLSQTLQNTGTTARTATYTITGYTTDAGGNLVCAGTPLDVDVIVEPDVTVTASDKTICNGASTNLDVNTVYSGSVGVVYSWTVTPNANVTGESDGPALGQSFAVNLSQNLTNNTTTAQVVNYHITGYTIDGLGNLVCAGPTLDVDITVEPTVLVTATDRTICNNTSTNIDVNTLYSGSVGTVYSWTVSAHGDITGESNGPATGQSFATNLSQTLQNVGLTARTATYTITGYTTDAGGNLVCGGTPLDVDVIVEPNVLVTASDITICNNTSTNLDVNTAYTGSEGVRYTWTAVAPDLTGESNGPVAGQDFAINLSQTLTNGDITSHTALYTITGYTTLSGSLNCAGTPLDVDVIVEPTVVVTSADKRICSNTSTDLDVNTIYTGSVGVRYNWTVSAPGTISGASDGPATGQAFNTNLSQTLINSGTAPAVVTYSITGYTTDGLGNLVCAGPTLDVDITVEPNVVVTAADRTICNNVNINMDVNTVYSGTNGVIYSWTVAAPASITGESNGPANGQNFAINISQTLQNSSTSAQTAVYTITGYTTDGGGLPECAGTPLDVDVIVEPVIQVTASDKTICSSTSTNLDVNTVYTGSIGQRYNWTVSAPGSVSGASNGPATGQDFGTNLSQTLINSSTSPQVVTYTIRGYSTDLGGNLVCSGPAITVNITVEPNVVVTAADDALCFHESTDIDVNTTYTSSNSIVYTWTVSAPGTVTGASNGPAGGQALNVNIQQTLDNNSFATENVLYTITPWTTNGLGALTCAGTNRLVTITTYPKPDATPVNNDPIIANGNPTDIEMDGNVAGTTFGWRVINPGATGATNGSGLAIGQTIAQVLTNTTGAPWTVTYRIGPSANGCTGDSVDVPVQVDPSVNMTVVNVKPDICTGDNTQIEVSSDVTGATFTWTVSDPDGAGAVAGTNVGPNTGITIQDNLVNAGTTTITVVYHITPTGPAPTFITGVTQDVTVHVYPKPQALPVNNAPRICNGSSTNIYLDSDVAGTTFTWTVNDPTGGASGATASGAPRAIGQTIAQTLVNSGTTPVTIGYVITPTGPAAGSCAGDAVTVNVIVDPTPVAAISNLRPEICSETETEINLSASVVGTTFDWHVADPKGTGAFDDSGVIGDKIEQTLVNPTQTPVTITYEILLTGPGVTACPGVTIYEDVQVDPLPNTTAITGVDTVCELTPNLFFSVTLTNDSYYEWHLPASLGTRTFGGSGLNSSGMVITAANIPGPAYVTDSLWVFETNQYSCTNDTIYHPLTLIPYPAVSTITGDAAVCAQTVHTYSVPNNPGSTYQWTVPVGAGVVTDPTLNQVDVLYGLLGGQIRVRETTAGGCVTNHTPLTITLSQLPVSTLNADQTAICNGETVTFTAGPAAQLNYEFFLNGVSVQSGASNIYTNNTLVNDDQVTVNVTSTAGCEKMSPVVQITVNPNPTVTLASSDADNIICNGESVTFEATSATASTYNFFRNGVSVKNGAQNFWTTTTLASGDAVYVEVLSAFGCAGTSATIVTAVNPLPSVNISGDNTVCPGFAAPLGVTLTTGSVPFDVTIDNGIGLVSFPATPGTYNVSPGVTTTYRISSVTDANGCVSTAPSARITGTATVTIRDTVRIITDPHDGEVCESVDTSFTVSAVGDGLLYQWQYTDDLANPFVNITAATPNHSGHNLATLDVLSPDAALDGYYYRVVVSSSFCPEFAISDTAQLTIRYNPLSARDPFDQVICENSSTGFGVDPGVTADPVYQWQISYNNGTSWLNLGDTAVYSGTHTDSLIISNASSRFDGYWYRVNITGDCGGSIYSDHGILTILERPEILTQPASVAVCEGDPSGFSVNAGLTDGVAYRWQVNMNDGNGYVDIASDTAGVYNGWQTASLALLNPVSRMNSYRYQVIVSGTCTPQLTSSNATLTVRERPEITTQPHDTTICEGDSPLFSVSAGVTSGVSYQWQVSYNSGTTWLNLGDTAIYSGANSSILRLFSVPSSYNDLDYRVVVSGTCTPAVNSSVIHLTVNERPEILSQPADVATCEGTATFFEVDGGVTTGAVYTWQVEMGSGFVTIGADSAGVYSGHNLPRLDLLSATPRMDGYQYRAIVSGTCSSPVTSDIATLTVSENVEITVQPADRIVCENETPVFTVNAGLTSNPVYQWQVQHHGAGVWFDLADTAIYNGSLTNTLRLMGVPSSYDGNRYRVVVDGDCNGPLTSTDVLLTVRERPEILEHPADTTVCESEAFGFTVDAGVTSGTIYEWRVDMGMGFVTIGADSAGIYSGYNTATLNLLNPVSRFDGYRYRAVVSGLCTPSVSSTAATLTINEKAEILTHPQPKVICEDANTFFTVNAGATTAPTYLWQVDMNDGNGFTDIGADTSVYTGTGTATLLLNLVPPTFDAYTYRVIVGGICPETATSGTALLTVREKPEILTQPVNDTVCENTPATFMVDAGVTSGVTYQWQVNRIGTWTSLTAADELSGNYTGVFAASLQVNNPSTSWNGYQYRVLVSGLCTPAVTSEAARLVIEENAEISQQPVPMTICEDDDTYFIVRPGNTTLPAYIWNYSTDGGATWLPASGLPEAAGAANDTLVLTTVPSTYDQYQFRPTVSGKCGVAVDGTAVVLTVYEKPQIDDQPDDVTACEQDTVFFAIDPGVTTNPVYTWEYFNGTSWATVSGTAYQGIHSDTLKINGVTPAMNGRQYRVVLSGQCSPDVTSSEATLTVDERPEILGQPVDAVVCENDDTFFGVNAGVTTDATFEWHYWDGGAWQTASMFTGWDSDTIYLTAVTNAWNNTDLRVLVSGKCTPVRTSNTANLTVYNRPVISVQPIDRTTCEGVATSFTVDAGITSNPVYTWEYNDGVNGWQTVSGAMYTGTATATLLVNTPNSSMDGWLYRVTVGGFCSPAVTSDEVSLTVQENSEIILQPVASTICENDNTSFTIDPGVTTSPVIEWFYNDGTSGWQTVTVNGVHGANGSATLDLTAVPFAYDNYLYRATVTGSCGVPVTSNTVNLVVYRRPEITLQPEDTASCELKNVTFTIQTGLTDGAFIQWEENDLVSGWQAISDGGNFIGTTTTQLKVFGVDSAMTGYQYRAVVDGTCNDPVTSDPATLTVYSAPAIWAHPQDQTICEGTVATFSVSATGRDLIYEWFEDSGSGPVSISNGGMYSGQGTSTLTITGAPRTMNLHRYYVRVSGHCQPWKQSNVAFLYVMTPPEIALQPADRTICEFQTASFTVSATGAGLSYQWYESTDGGATFSPLTDAGYYIGSTIQTLNIFNVSRSYEGNRYRVEVNGTCLPSATSNDVGLTVNVPPLITAQPDVNVAVCQNNPATFSVTAEGSALTFQWKVNRNDGLGYVDILPSNALYSGQQTDELTLLNAQTSQNGYSYRVLIVGPCAPSVLSNPSTLNVDELPVISVQPLPMNICEGNTGQFSANASGPSLSYQWMVSTDGVLYTPVTDGIDYSGSQTDQLMVTNPVVAMNGYRYRLDINSACNMVSTNPVVLTVWPNPTTAITGDLGSFPLVCGGELLTLNGNPAGGSGSYSHQWTGDIMPLYETNAQIVHFRTLLKGDYDLTYTVTDNHGCIGQSSVTIQNDRPVAMIESDAKPSCGYMEVHFTNRSSSDATSLLWEFGDGQTSADPNPVHGFDNIDPTGAVKYYNVNLIAETAFGCRDTAMSVVTIYPKVDPTFTVTPTEGCSPFEATLQTQPGASDYIWDYGDGNVAHGQFITYHLYENYTSAIVVRHAKLTTTSYYGCTAESTVDITVNPVPHVRFSASPLVQTFPDATVTFTNNTDAGPWTYLWKYGDGNLSASSAGTHTHEYAEPGVFDVVLYVNTAECTDSLGTTITINPQAPVAAFTAPEEGCHPTEVQFVNNSLWATSYQWQFGDGTISTQENPVHIFYQPADYTVKLIATGPGGTSQTSQIIYIHATPQVFFNYTPDSVFVKDLPVKFFNISAYADRYEWNFGDYDEITGAPGPDNTSTESDPTHVYYTEGWKDVKLAAFNEYCSDSLTIPKAIKVIPAGELKFPNIFSPTEPNGGYVDPTGEIVNNVFYPGINKQVSEYHLYIYNRWGELLFESTDINVGWDGYIKETKAAQGVYIWKVTGIYSNGKPFSEAGDVTLVWR
ncbi:MAG: PKD-like domain-containing protein [Bacteroidota bacterium]